MMVMKNITGDTPFQYDRSYDLKGSSYDRLVSVKKLAGGDIGRDMNFINDGKKIDLEKEVTERLLAQFKKDVQFLYSTNVNDYSLLVAVHKKPTWAQPEINKVQATSLIMDDPAGEEESSLETSQTRPHSLSKLKDSNRFERIYKTGKTVDEKMGPADSVEKMYNWTLVRIFILMG